MATFTVYRTKDGSHRMKINAPSSTEAKQTWAGHVRHLFPGKSKIEVAIKASAKRDPSSTVGRPKLFGL